MAIKRKKSLAHGRPVTATKPRASLSSKATRTLIRSHHQLERSRARADKSGDATAVAAISKQIEEQGGLDGYQQASIIGQSAARGGDTSKVLLEWLQPSSSNFCQTTALRVLEIGALSVDNAISKSRRFDVTRIDLNSQRPGILTQDFMTMPLPESDAEKFNLISLSLVLNYVPHPEGRGQMLRRTCDFLRVGDRPESSPRMTMACNGSTWPSLFLVLPAPCVTNSRYMDEETLTLLMASLGYVPVFRKLSSKLIYLLWHFDQHYSSPAKFAKKEVNPGRTRNNFSIVLQ